MANRALANRRLQPLGHPSTDKWGRDGVCQKALSTGPPMGARQSRGEQTANWHPIGTHPFRDQALAPMATSIALAAASSLSAEKAWA
jgi:hypothetical protein